MSAASADCGQMKEKTIHCSDTVLLMSVWRLDIAPQIKKNKVLRPEEFHAAANLSRPVFPVARNQGAHINNVNDHNAA